MYTFSVSTGVLAIGLLASATLKNCGATTPAPPDPANAQAAATATGKGQAEVASKTDEALRAKDQAYNQLASQASVAAAAVTAASQATQQNPQQNQHTSATVNELEVAKANLGEPRPEDLAAANSRLAKALSGVAADREAIQREYDRLVGEGRARQAQLDQLNQRATEAETKLKQAQDAFKKELDNLNNQLTELAAQAAAAQVEEARQRREAAAATRRQIALGCAAVGAVLFVLSVVALVLKLGAAVSVICAGAAAVAVAAGVIISAVEDVLTKPWFWPSAGGLVLVALAGGGWFAWRAVKTRQQLALVELQAKSNVGAIQELRNDAKLLAAQLDDLNLEPSARAQVEAKLKKTQDAWETLSGYLDEWHRDPKTGKVNEALVAKIKADAVALNLKTEGYDPVAKKV